MFSRLIAMTWVTALTISAFSFVSNANPLPAKAFASLPDITQVTLSPDGTKVASLQRYEHKGTAGVLLNVFNFKTRENKTLTSSDNSKFVIGWITWANNNEIFVSTHYPTNFSRTPTTQTNLLKFNISGGDPRHVIPPRVFEKNNYTPSRQDNIIDMMPEKPDEILISIRTGHYAIATNVMRVNLKRNSTKIIHKARSDTLDWITDRQNNVRIAYKLKDTKLRYEYLAAGSKGPWRSLFEFEAFSSQASNPLGFDVDPNILYFSAYHEGRKAVFKMDLSNDTSSKELVFSNKEYDINGSLVFSELANKVVGIRHNVGNSHYFWDSSFNNIANSIDSALPNTVNHIIDFSKDERRFLILATSDNDPGTYYVWDRDSRRMNAIALRYNKLTSELMAEKQPIEYHARDGLKIEGFLTRPNTKPNNSQDEPGPAIIFPHGGPISHDGNGFDYWTQFFANQGYTVLQMNFRGSSGYGHSFMASGLKDWGGKMQTDVEDGTRWLIDQGIADPNRVCIVGASYGGYAALMEAANNSDLYQCAVSFAGVTDLRKLIKNSRKYINHKIVKEQVGSNMGELKKRSPVVYSSEIDIPVMLAHGDKDTVVPVAHSHKMHKALKKHGKKVTYFEYENGTHYLSNEKHRISLFESMATFLATYLK